MSYESGTIAFDEEYARALVKPLGSVAVRFVSIPICEGWLMPGTDDKAIDWSLTTWEGAEREQLRRWAQLSLEEIVRAQEEMQSLAERLGSTAGDRMSNRAR